MIGESDDVRKPDCIFETLERSAPAVCISESSSAVSAVAAGLGEVVASLP